ncbi:hypothetical protein V6307_14900 [Serratia marcescens]|uniref:hypothetical protein n=1 Tax=Serratia marcescens TaxID=615 RepID=UPI0036F6B56A
MGNKLSELSELSKPVMYSITCNGVVEEIGGDSQGFVREEVQAELDSWENGSVGIPDGYSVSALYSQEYVSALLARIEELEWRELNSTELKELLTWHPTEMSAATDPILWAAMRNKINFTLAWVAADEAKKEQSNG